jgi:hypothetical protein
MASEGTILSSGRKKEYLNKKHFAILYEMHTEGLLSKNVFLV